MQVLNVRIVKEVICLKNKQNKLFSKTPENYYN